MDGLGKRLLEARRRDGRVVARLLANAESMLRRWEEYEANLRLPEDQRRALLLPEPRISAESLRWLVAELRPALSDPGPEVAA